MSQKTLKFDNIEVSQKEFHVFKQPIALGLVNVNQILIPHKFEQKILNILLATKMIKMEEKICLLWLKMMTYWLNIMKFGTKLKRH